MKSFFAYCMLFAVTVAVMFFMPIGIIPAFLTHAAKIGWKAYFDLIGWTDKNTPLY